MQEALCWEEKNMSLCIKVYATLDRLDVGQNINNVESSENCIKIYSFLLMNRWSGSWGLRPERVGCWEKRELNL